MSANAPPAWAAGARALARAPLAALVPAAALGLVPLAWSAGAGLVAVLAFMLADAFHRAILYRSLLAAPPPGARVFLGVLAAHAGVRLVLFFTALGFGVALFLAAASIAASRGGRAEPDVPPIEMFGVSGLAFVGGLAVFAVIGLAYAHARMALAEPASARAGGAQVFRDWAATQRPAPRIMAAQVVWIGLGAALAAAAGAAVSLAAAAVGLGGPARAGVMLAAGWYVFAVTGGAALAGARAAWLQRDD